jgi:hypothetical protein
LVLLVLYHRYLALFPLSQFNLQFLKEINYRSWQFYQKISKILWIIVFTMTQIRVRFNYFEVRLSMLKIVSLIKDAPWMYNLVVKGWDIERIKKEVYGSIININNIKNRYISRQKKIIVILVTSIQNSHTSNQ